MPVQDCGDASMEKLATAPIPNLILNYSLPSMLGLFAIAFYEAIDRIFVGQFVGNEGLAVMTVGMPFVILLGSCCIMLRVGGGSALARSLGKGDFVVAAKVLGNTFALLFGVGLTLAVAGNVLAEWIVRLSGSTEGLFQGAVLYVKIIAAGAPLLFVSNGANAILRATGSPRKGLLLIVGSCCANVILDAVFVAYLGWGVPGAAWATVIAQGLGAVYGVWQFVKKENLVRLSAANLYFNLQLVREIIGVGFAYAMFEINFMVVVAITNNMLESYGSSLALAGIAVVNSCVTFLYMPMTGLDEGLQPVIGFNFGAGNRRRVRRIAASALGAGLAFFTVSFLMIQFGAEFIVALFVDDNPAFLVMTARALRITFAVAPIMAFMIVIPGILSALGEVRFNFILSMGIQFFVQIPALFILPRYFGVDGVWMSFPLVDIAASLLALSFLLKSFKRHGLLSSAAGG